VEIWRRVLNNVDRDVKVVVLDPENEYEIELTAHQLDYSPDYPLQDFRRSENVLVARASTLSMVIAKRIS
jgi:hypothetical protein